MPELKDPMDFIRALLEEQVELKCHGGRTIQGRLCGYDAHLNMVIQNAKCSMRSGSDSSSATTPAVTQDVLFVRGDGIVHVAAIAQQ